MRTFALTLVALLVAVNARAFEGTLRAHGGYWNWAAYRTMRFDVTGWPFSREAAARDAQTVDLRTGRLRVDGGRPGAWYALGFDGRTVWADGATASLAAPPRFYALTPYRFIGMPFVLAEPEVVQEDLGRRKLNGAWHEVYRFRSPGRGTFLAYVDPATDLLYAVVFDAGNAVVFDEWQEVDGLTVPRRVSFHEWNAGALGARKATFTVRNAHFDRAAAHPSAFAAPVR